MATPHLYTVNGKTFEFDEPLTQAELEELKAKVGGAPAAPPKPDVTVTRIGDREIEQPEETATVASQPITAASKGPQEPAGIIEYLINAAKRGITGTTSAAGTAYETGAEMIRKLREMEDRARREKMTVEQRMDMLRQSGYFPSLAELAEKYGEQQRSAARLTGARDLTAPGPVTEIVGAGVEAMTDPFGLIGKAKVVPVAKRAIGEFTTGAAADVGGRGGAALETAVTGEESGIGRLAGSLLAGSTTAAKREAISNIAEQATPAILRASEKIKQVVLGGKPSESEQQIITGAAKRLLDFAAQERGAKSIDDILKEASEASQFVTGSDAPLLVAMADNPVIRQQVIRLAKTDPAFRQQVNETLARLKGDMRSKVEKIFGSRYEAAGGERSIFEPDYKPGKQVTTGLDIGNVTQRREVLSRRIEDIASGFEPTATKEDIGRRIESLIEDRRILVGQEMSPKYKELINKANASGIKMPKEGVAMIYDFVEQNNLRDIFGKGTPLDKQIMQVLKPMEFPVPGSAETVLEHLPLSFDNVDSLKRAINELKRGRMSADALRRVEQLEDVVDEARKTIPGDFNDKLKALDLEYYQKVGVPFGAQGIKDIDSKAYSTQVAPVILKNTESFNQFVRAVGKENGFKVAEDSIISDIYDKVVEDGVIKPSKLAIYMKQKEGIIKQIPGLKEKLTTALVDDSQVRARIDALDDAANVAQKRIADNALTKFDAPNYNALARSFMADPGARAKLLRDIGDLDAESARAVRRTLRAEVVNLADSNPSGFVNYLMDPKNKDALDQIFGSAFQPALQKVGLLADKVSQADISKIGMSVGAEKLDVLEKNIEGLSLPRVMSILRDRITSVPQKITILMSRINAAKLSGKTDEAIKELLLDPNGVQKLAKVATDINFSIDASGRIRKLANAVSDVMPRALYTSGKTAVSSQERELREKKRREQLSEDIITGGFEDSVEKPVEKEPAEQTAAPEAEAKAEPVSTNAEPYTFESLTPNQVKRMGEYFDSLGMNKDFLLNARTFNATPLEKRKRLFDLMETRNMADGGLITPGNIDVSKLPAVRNPDGTVSTVRSMSINVDGKEVLIPTVVNGRVVSEKEAIDQYMKTRRHLGIFDTPEAATAYAQKLHESEAQRVKKARGGYTPAEEVLLRRYSSR